MSTFNMVASMNESTVVSEYIPESKRSDSYQSEADLENEFIRMLVEQGYEYLQIHTEAELIANLRKKVEQLNSYNFTDTEWERFFHKYIANANEGIVEKTRTIQEDAVKNMERDDGSTKNITLLDKKNIHNNRLQVINQYEVSQNEGAKFDNRYDVTILVNGFPLIHVELKRRGVAIREAFNQINRYQRDSFGQEADYMNMCRYLLFQMEHIQSIIPIPLVLPILKSRKRTQVEAKRPAIVLSSLLFGRMQIIKSFLTL